MENETRIPIPGSLALDELENSINTKENVERCRLIALSKSDVPNEKKNVGVFVKAPRGVDVPEVRLIKVEDGQSVEQIKPNGKETVFHSVVFVKDEEQDIAGFR